MLARYRGSDSVIPGLDHVNKDLLCDPQASYLTFMKVKVAQLCPTLCDPMDYTVSSLPAEPQGSPRI